MLVWMLPACFSRKPVNPSFLLLYFILHLLYTMLLGVEEFPSSTSKVTQDIIPTIFYQYVFYLKSTFIMNVVLKVICLCHRRSKLQKQCKLFFYTIHTYRYNVVFLRMFPNIGCWRDCKIKLKLKLHVKAQNSYKWNN